MSPCFLPHFMYSTKPNISQLRIALGFVTTVPLSSKCFGPYSKLPLGNKPPVTNDKVTWKLAAHSRTSSTVSLLFTVTLRVVMREREGLEGFEFLAIAAAEMEEM
ncbi:hypothetical protein ACFX1Q_039108 [Malus domestica]